MHAGYADVASGDRPINRVLKCCEKARNGTTWW